MKTKKNGAVLRLLVGSLILIGLTADPALAHADDAGVATTEVVPIDSVSVVPAATSPAPTAAPTPPAQIVVTPQPSQTGIERLSDQLLAVLLPVFVTFIGGLALLLLNKLKKKFGLDVSDKTTEQWAALARSAAQRGAEWARKKAKEELAGKKVPGPEVLDVAVNWATEMAVWQGLPELARSKLEGLIEAELFKLRQEDESRRASMNKSQDPYAIVEAAAKV